MKSKTTIEKLVSDAVQQSPLGTFSIDGREYVIDRPRVRTMIVVSELISQLPEVKQDKTPPSRMSLSSPCALRRTARFWAI